MLYSPADGEGGEIAGSRLLYSKGGYMGSCPMSDDGWTGNIKGLFRPLDYCYYK
ncbi:hypothetical protein DCCM_3601 [Desulfocucumis palustris]|uniref:Uncharacterized protein n=1 Tax=Desulfocucumis palustris TaxID=1898651 RepID=A0A2L2XFL3_9FIRM|nr:hypothetical protein DCCM_3601 [Desulfocucumis palustris]